jgi:diguanylate cyclase (GGDEF)-like protein
MANRDTQGRPPAARGPARPRSSAARHGRNAWRSAWRSLLLLAWALLLAPAARADAQLTVQLDHRPGFQNAGYYVALMRGYYRDAGLDVDLRPRTEADTRVIDRVTSGAADVGVTGLALLSARLSGEPLVALAAIGHRDGRVWVARAGLPRRADGDPNLSGIDPARIGWRGAVEDNLSLMQQLHHWGVADWMAVSPALASQEELEQRYARGELDLVAIDRVGASAKLSTLGGLNQLLFEVDHPVRGYSEVLFTREDFARDRPQQVERFVAATLRGWREAFADVEGSARLVHSRYAPDVPLERLIGQGQDLAELARLDEIDLGHMSPLRWSRIASDLAPMGLAGKQALLDGLVWQRDLPSAPLTPDPVRWSLMCLVLAQWLVVWALWRHGARAHRELVDLRAAQQHSQEDDLRFQFLMDVAPFPVLMFGLHDGVIAYANERAIGAFDLGEGLGAAELKVQDSLPALMPGEALMARLQSSRILRDIELERPGRAGAPSRWTLLTMRAVEFEGKSCAFAAAIDISRRKQAEIELGILNAQRGRIIDEVEQLQSKLRDASVRDPLTGLFNRRYLDATLQRELHRARREGTPLALLMVDADHFKRINDHYGHAGGDEVLRAVAGVLTGSHRSEDVVCRFGGEEFVVVLPGSDLALAQARAEEVRLSIERLQIATDGGFARVTVSVGVATRRADEDAESLFKRADLAVYAAKAGGRNRVVVAEGEPVDGTAGTAAAPAVTQAAGDVAGQAL